MVYLHVNLFKLFVTLRVAPESVLQLQASGISLPPNLTLPSQMGRPSIVLKDDFEKMTKPYKIDLVSDCFYHFKKNSFILFLSGVASFRSEERENESVVRRVGGKVYEVEEVLRENKTILFFVIEWTEKRI